MATNYGTLPIVSEGLIWRVDASNNPKNLNVNGANSVIGNTATIGFSGSLQGGMSRVTSEPQYWEFDGDDDYIQFAANSTINGSNVLSLYGKTTATFEFWIAPDYTGDDYQRVISKSNTGGGGIGGYALLLQDKNLLFYIDNGSGAAVYTADYITSANAGEWIHIAITRNGNSYVMYENGVVKDTNTASATFVNTSSGLRLGSWVHSTGREYNGKLAVAAIYDVTLSGDQVRQNYNALKLRFE
jgi:hypothetical protein